MRDVFSNETLKEINDLIDEIIENLDDNVETVENPLAVSRENGIASIFTATNYDGTQRVFSASDTTIHILLDGNEDAGKSQRRSLKFTIGDKSGVAFEKNDDDTQYYIWWESDFGIDQQNDGCLWFRFDGDYGTDDTYPVKAYYTYKMTGLTAGKTYTITFTGGFGTTTPENFNLGGALIVSELVGQTMTTIAQEDFDSDAQTHSYSVTFTSTGTEVYLKFDFTNVIKTSDPHALVFAVDEFTYTGLDLGVTGAYVWLDGWHLISTGGGGGTSDLDAIELTYAEYQALSPAEKTDPDKIYFITDYPASVGALNDLSDVDITTPTEGQILTYDDTDDEWKNTDVDDIAPTVTEASTRANIATGDTLKTIIGKIKKFFSDLKAVAFTGAYSDLSGTPTIPTVNNGTLTIKRNNTSVGTFTANQSSASNINIECATPSDVEGSKTATGSIVTITDAADIYAEEVDVAVECMQTGSGIPSPSNIRPIQGYDIVSVDRCGKNLFGDIQYGYTIYQNEITANVNCWMHIFKCEGETELNVKIFDKGSYGGSFNVICSVDGINFDSDAILTVQYPSISNGYSTTLTIPSGKKYIAVYGYMSGHGSSHYINTSKVQISFDSIGNTYEPYNGQTVSLQLGNKNLLPMTVEGIKAANSNGTWSGNVYSRNNVSFTVLTDENGLVTGIKANGTASGGDATIHVILDYESLSAGKYIVNGSIGGSASTYDLYCGFRINGSATYFNSYNGDSSVITYGASDKIYFIDVRIRNTKTVSNQIFYPMLRSATVTDPTFSPYNPTLGGMVYGGQLTLNDDGSAVFVEDRACVDLGSLTWSYNSQYSLFYSYLSDGEKTGTGYGLDSALCSAYNVSTANHREINNGEISVGNNVISSTTCGVVIKDTRYTDATAFKTAVTGQTLVYELATPFTIHLFAEQLKLLKGYNYISSNGTTIHLTYQPDNAVGDAVSKAEKYTDRLCKTGVVDTFNLYNGNTKVGSVSLLSNGIKLLYISSIDDGSVFGMNIPDKYVPKGPYQRAVICFEDSYANPRIIEIYQNHITVTEDKFEHGDTYGTGLYY